MAITQHTGVADTAIAGLAVARHLTADGHEATVSEKKDQVARHSTGRSSGVAPAGIYYAPGSA